MKLMVWKHCASMWKISSEERIRKFHKKSGNFWKTPVSFLKFTMRWNKVESSDWLFPGVETRGNQLWFPIQGNEVESSGYLFPGVETRGNHLWGLTPSFQFRESRWNPRVDCFQVWKPGGNHIGVSPKWKLRGNYWCHDS